MRSTLFVPLAASCVMLLGACTDTPRVTPLTPTDPSLASSSECSGSLASQISKDQKALYSGSTLDSAQALFQVIKSGCPGTKAEMLGYVQFTLDHLPAPRPSAAGTLEQNLITHWQRLFAYVGYVSAADIPSAPGVLAVTGGAAVFDLGDPEDTLLTNDGYAGIRVPGQNTLTGPRLFTIEKTAGTCFATNLQQQGGCYTFGIYPHTTGFDPKLVFGICESTEPDLTNKSLGHQPENGPFVVLTPMIPGFCPDAHGASGLDRLRGRGPLGRLLASVAGVFMPAPLLAAHGGLGGEDDAASPVGGVNTQTFFADFNNDAVGQKPGTPEVGAWTADTAPPPGYIVVQSAIGNLADQPVVLSQAGGACTNCGTLELRGTMFNSGAAPADAGTYEVRWNSLQDKPSVKDAPLVLRDSNRRELARLSYATVSSVPLLLYNGKATGCNWTQSVSQHFVVTVDLGAGTTSLSIDGCTTQNAATTRNVGFVNPAASDFASVAWVLSGIDAGIIGWDDVEIVRLPDK